MFAFTKSAPIRNRNVHNLRDRISDHEFLFRNPRFSACERRVSSASYPSGLDRRGEAFLCSL